MSFVLWVMQVAIAACDMAEVIGSARLQPLFHIPLFYGADHGLDVSDFMLQRWGFRHLALVIR
jgi:hypothetical protein